MVKMLSADMWTDTLPRVTAATLNGVFVFRTVKLVELRSRFGARGLRFQSTLSRKKKKKKRNAVIKKKNSSALSSCKVWRKGWRGAEVTWEARVEGKCCTRAGRVSSASVFFPSQPTESYDRTCVPSCVAFTCSPGTEA